MPNCPRYCATLNGRPRHPSSSATIVSARCACLADRENGMSQAIICNWTFPLSPSERQCRRDAPHGIRARRHINNSCFRDATGAKTIEHTTCLQGVSNCHLEKQNSVSPNQAAPSWLRLQGHSRRMSGPHFNGRSMSQSALLHAAGGDAACCLQIPYVPGIIGVQTPWSP